MSYVLLISETICFTPCMLLTKPPLLWITALWVTISTKLLESKVMHFSEEHLETIMFRLCDMITRWDPDRREMENLPDQPEMLDLMLMKNETELYFHPNNAMDKALLLLNVNPGLRKVNKSVIICIPSFCLLIRLSG